MQQEAQSTPPGAPSLLAGGVQRAAGMAEPAAEPEPEPTEIRIVEAGELATEHTGCVEWEEAGENLLQFATAEIKRITAGGGGGSDALPAPRVLELGCGCGAVGLGRAQSSAMPPICRTPLPSCEVFEHYRKWCRGILTPHPNLGWRRRARQ